MHVYATHIYTGNNNRLYQTGTAYYSEGGNKDEYTIYPYNKHYDFSPAINMSDTWSVVECILYFAVSFGDQHNLSSHGGYLFRLLRSRQYEEALKELQIKEKERERDSSNMSFSMSGSGSGSGDDKSTDGYSIVSTEAHTLTTTTHDNSTNANKQHTTTNDQHTDTTLTTTTTTHSSARPGSLLDSFLRLPNEVEPKDNLKITLQTIIILAVDLARRNWQHAHAALYVWTRRIGILLLIHTYKYSRIILFVTSILIAWQV